ncbi:MAG: type 2 isopentenyl-diphosphate Delta-isomerase [Ignavibacteria bacterium]|nr:type 2 isopentenyl-diphosphate Delta-isomerase [Ignavibacteria bacterium]
MPGSRSPRTTSSRKKQHVELAVSRDVRFQNKLTGLERIEFVHNALPEIDLSEVDLSTTFLGRTIRLPLMISCMTGGYSDALRINRGFASVCEELQIPLGVGSQRQALENSRYLRSFTAVRACAPTIPVIGNIGAAEVVRLGSADAERLVEMTEADALAVHLNPLQEFLQPEGNPNFRGVLAGVERLVRTLPVPVIVKEIGAGISGDVARRLIECGVRYIDVAGAGGTSWAGIELLRRPQKDRSSAFWDWGIPLVTSLREVAAHRTGSIPLTIVASGGISNGIEAAKCLALGADIAASARVFLLALRKGGVRSLKRLIGQWEEEMRGVMFLTGSTTISDLKKAPLTSIS